METVTENLVQNTPFFKNPVQANIYLCLLKEGPLGAEKISQNIGIYRESVQRELKKMGGVGTITLIQQGRNKKAQAVPLSVLQDKLEKSKENFESLLKPLLEVESNKKMPKVEIYTGNHAFGLLQMKLIKLQPKYEDILVISAHPKEWLNAMTETQKLSIFEKTRLEKGVIFKLSCYSELRGEVEHNNREYFAGQPEKLKRQFKYVESESSSPAQVQIWFDCIVMSIFESYPSIHIVIKDIRIVKAMKTHFSILWNIGVR